MASFLSKLSKFKPRKGFTLIELLVVMGVLSLLASAIMFSTDNARDKGKDAKRKQDLNALSTSLIAFYADNGSFPPLDENSTVLDYSSPRYNAADQNWIPDLDPYIEEQPKDPLQTSLVTRLASAVTSGAKNITSQIAGTFKSKNEPKPQVAAIQTKTYNIAAGNDDVQGGHSGDFPGFSKTVNILQTTKSAANGYYKPGLRFTNIDLPSNTNIIAARLKFTPKNDTALEKSLNSAAGVNIKITTDITHTPGTQVADYNDFYAKWDIPNQPPSQWKVISDAPVWYNGGSPVDPANTTFDVTDLVKGEINRSAWQTNYPIDFFLMPDDDAGFSPGRGRVFYAYEFANNSTLTPKLEIDYDTTPIQGPQIIACEAESGTRVAGTSGQFTSIADGTATGGFKISSVSPNGDDHFSDGETVGPTGGNAGSGTGGSSLITVYPTTGGTYYLWARINYPTTPESLGENNSFWMQINNKGPDGTANTFFRVGNDNTSGWHWVNFRNGLTSDIITTSLNAGSANTIKIWSREDDTQIDKLELVNSSTYAVTGNGDTINCPTSAGTKTASITANGSTNDITVASGSNVTIAWSSTNTSSCSVTSSPAGFSGSGTSGSQTTGALTGPTSITYSVSCDAGAISDSIIVTVDAPAGGGTKTANITANDSTSDITVASGSNVTIAWTSTNITGTCTVSGTFASAPPPSTSGSQATGALTGPASITYSVSCDSGAAQDSVNVDVDAPTGGGGNNGGGGTRTACAATSESAAVFYCYRVSQDRKSFIIWARLENTNDPDIYNKANSTSACNSTDANVVPPNTYVNYCVKSPTTLNIN